MWHSFSLASITLQLLKWTVATHTLQDRVLLVHCSLLPVSWILLTICMDVLDTGLLPVPDLYLDAVLNCLLVLTIACLILL